MTAEEPEERPEEVFTASYIHGIADVVRTTGVARLFWFILFIIAVAVAIFSCIGIAQTFVEQKTATETSLNYKWAMTLPDVVVCPFQRFKNAEFFGEETDLVKQKEYRRLVSSLFLITGRYGYMNLFTDFGYLTKTGEAVAQELDTLLQTLGGSLSNFVAEATWKCEDLIASCNVDMGELKIGTACCKPGRLFTPFGYCPVVKGMEQNITGIKSGENVELKPFLKGMDAKEYYEFGQLNNQGIQLGLLDKDGSYPTEFFHVPMGFYARIVLNKIQQNLLATRKRKCVKALTSQAECTYRCILRETMTNSGEANAKCKECLPLLLLNVSQANPRPPVCSVVDTYSCLTKPFLTSALSSEQNAGLQICKKECPLPCDPHYYDMTMTYAKLENVDNSSDEYVAVNLAYGDVEMHETTQSLVMNEFSLIANIGGTMGVWIGASIISFLQLIMIAFDYCSDQRKKKQIEAEADEKY